MYDTFVNKQTITTKIGNNNSISNNKRKFKTSYKYYMPKCTTKDVHEVYHYHFKALNI